MIKEKFPFKQKLQKSGCVATRNIKNYMQDSRNVVAGLLVLNTGLFKMIVGVLTTCHAQYTSDSSICIFLFNRTTLQVSVAYLTGALYIHPL